MEQQFSKRRSAVLVSLALASLAPATFAACGGVSTPIHDVQGSGDTSPLQGKTVSVEGVISGVYAGDGQLSGFYMQETAHAGYNANGASEGVFVYLNKLAAPALRPGDVVRVSGKVTEYKSNGGSETQIAPAAAGDVEACGYTASVPTTTLKLPLTSERQLKSLEGMAVRFAQPLYVAGNHDYGRYGELILSSQPRLWTATQRHLPGSDAARALMAANALDKITLDDGYTTQNRDAWLPAPGGLSARNTLRSGDRLDGVSGIVSYRYGKFRLHPLSTPFATPANPRAAAPWRQPDTIRFASFNVLNYFNGDGMGGGFPTERGAKSYQDFQRQRAKIVSALRALDADVVGLMEIENDGFAPRAAIDDLVGALNAGQPASRQYRYIDPGVPKVGTDAITTGLIYRPAAVIPEGAAQIKVIGNPGKNRPSLWQTFVLDGMGKNRVTVAVNHIKSKGSSCADLVVDGQNDVDKGDGQGNCNLTRTQAARDLTSALSALPRKDRNHGVLVLGDFNAYAKEDPIRTLEGAGYANLLERFGYGKVYSYVYNGESGNLDHALADAVLAERVKHAGEWHINADEPSALEYGSEYKSPAQQQKYYAPDAYRSSDHDPLFVDVSRRGKPVSAGQR